MKKTLTKENLPIKYEKRKKYSIRGFENVAPYTLSSWGILEQLHVGYMLENFDDIQDGFQ